MDPRAQDRASERGPVRLGVIGAGSFVSRRHLPDAVKNPDVEVAAICRRDAAALTRMADHFQVSHDRAFTDWQRMLGDVELDAVLVATPNALHFQHARAALERGLHVLVEKPLATRHSEAQELVRLASEKGLQLGVALNPPFWAHCHQIRRALKDERMGTLEGAALYWTAPVAFAFGRGAVPEKLPGVVPPTLFRADPELTGGGYLQDGGCHLVSELLWLTGLRVRRVSALLDSFPQDMKFSLNLEMENGLLATILSAGDSHASQRRVRVTLAATGGLITVMGQEFETVVMLHGQEHRKFREAEIVPVSQPVANFVDAILDRGKLLSPGQHGADVAEVVEAAYLSANTGSVVTLPLADAPPAQAVVNHSPARSAAV